MNIHIHVQCGNKATDISSQNILIKKNLQSDIFYLSFFELVSGQD